LLIQQREAVLFFFHLYDLIGADRPLQDEDYFQFNSVSGTLQCISLIPGLNLAKKCCETNFTESCRTSSDHPIPCVSEYDNKGVKRLEHFIFMNTPRFMKAEYVVRMEAGYILLKDLIQMEPPPLWDHYLLNFGQGMKELKDGETWTWNFNQLVEDESKICTTPAAASRPASLTSAGRSISRTCSSSSSSSFVAPSAK
jgi:hypothetical protein